MRFFFHYNKPASRAKGKPQISVHFQNSCHIVDNVKVNVKTFGRVRKTAPYFVMVGDAKQISAHDGQMTIS